MKLSKSELQGFILYFLVFFMVFDGVRSNLIISGFISPIRELSLNLFILSCIPLLAYCKRKDFLMAVPFFFISVMVLVNIPVTVLNDISSYNSKIQIFENKYSAFYKHLIFSVIFISAIVYARSFLHKLKSGLNLFINLAVFYSIITIPVYLYGFPLFVEKFRDWGRMGIGYPTMDGQMICFAIYCLIFFVRQKSKTIFNMKMGALLLGLIAQNTGTAMATMVLIFVTAFIKKPGKTAAYLFFMLPLLVGLIIKCYYSDPEFFSQMIFITGNKVNQLINPGMSAASGQLDTLQIRAAQYEKLNVLIDHNIILRLFGVGGQAYIENEFRLTLAAYGIFTFFFFVLSFFWMSTLILMSKNSNKFLIIVLLVMWSFTSYTLSSIHLFTTSFCFCMVFAYAYISGEVNVHVKGIDRQSGTIIP